MIARIWTGVTSGIRADEYYEYIRRTGIPGLTQTPGNQGVYIFRQLINHEAHFMMISLWDSFEAIKTFAGEDISRTRLYPDDNDFLIRYDSKVTHYEVLEFQAERA